PVSAAAPGGQPRSANGTIRPARACATATPRRVARRWRGGESAALVRDDPDVSLSAAAMAAAERRGERAAAVLPSRLVLEGKLARTPGPLRRVIRSERVAAPCPHGARQAFAVCVRGGPHLLSCPREE